MKKQTSFLKRLLITGLFFHLLVGCQSEHGSTLKVAAPTPKEGAAQPTSPDEVFELRDNPYQIGAEWNRAPVKNEDDYAGQIFQLYRAGMGAVGTGFYIGEFGGKHLVMTAAHTYKDLVSCEDEVSFIAKSEKFDLYFFCSGWSYQLKDNDILFIEIASDDEGAFEKLKAVKFSNREFSKGDQLRLLTIDRDMPEFSFHWSVDESVDCVLMSSLSRTLKDPDSVILQDGEKKISSWSLPVGCDGMHGDSGSPVLNSESELVGVLWTGKHPKTSQVESIKNLSDKAIWSELNYIVPASKISEELHGIVSGQNYLSLYTKTMLQNIADALDGVEIENEFLLQK